MVMEIVPKQFRDFRREAGLEQAVAWVRDDPVTLIPLHILGSVLRPSRLSPFLQQQTGSPQGCQREGQY